MSETSKCPKRGTDNDARVKYCLSCSALMPGFEAARRATATSASHETLGEAEYLKSIDRTLKTIKNIALWFLALSLAGVIAGLLYNLVGKLTIISPALPRPRERIADRQSFDSLAILHVLAEKSA